MQGNLYFYLSGRSTESNLKLPTSLPSFNFKNYETSENQSLRELLYEET
jgi:hypothetical protein